MATLLAGWGASVRLASPWAPTSEPTELPLLDFLSGSAGAEATVAAAAGAHAGVASSAGGGQPVVTNVLLPLPAGGDYFWCHKVGGRAYLSCLSHGVGVQPLFA